MDEYIHLKKNLSFPRCFTYTCGFESFVLIYVMH